MMIGQVGVSSLVRAGIINRRMGTIRTRCFINARPVNKHKIKYVLGDTI